MVDRPQLSNRSLRAIFASDLYRSALNPVATVQNKIGTATAELFLKRIADPDKPPHRLIFQLEPIVPVSCESRLQFSSPI
jgi:DNA-binding LacI/PurR family transcriptional regulator